MEWADELHEALFEMTYNPNLTRDQWREAIDAKVRELIERYREEHSQGSTGPRVASSEVPNYSGFEKAEGDERRNAG